MKKITITLLKPVYFFIVILGMLHKKGAPEDRSPFSIRKVRINLSLGSSYFFFIYRTVFQALSASEEEVMKESFRAEVKSSISFSLPYFSGTVTAML